MKGNSWIAIIVIVSFLQQTVHGKICQKVVSASKTGGTFTSTTKSVRCDIDSSCCASGCCSPVKVTWDVWFGIGVGIFLLIIGAIFAYCCYKQRNGGGGMILRRKNPSSKGWNTIAEPQNIYQI